MGIAPACWLLAEDVSCLVRYHTEICCDVNLLSIQLPKQLELGTLQKAASAFVRLLSGSIEKESSSLNQVSNSNRGANKWAFLPGI